MASSLYHWLASGGFPKSDSRTAWRCWCVALAAEGPGPVTRNLENSSSKEARRQEQVGTSRDFEREEEGDLSQTVHLQAGQRRQRSASDWNQGQHLSLFNAPPHTRTHVWSCLHSLVTLSLSSVTPGHSKQSLTDFKPASYTAVMAHCEVTNNMSCFEKCFSCFPAQSEKHQYTKNNLWPT